MPPVEALPEELRPQRAPIAFGAGPSADADVVAVYADEAAVGLPVSSPAQLVSMMTAVPFRPAVIGVARVAAIAYALRADPHAQLRLAAEIFGEGLLLDRLRGFVQSEKPQGFVFAEQNMMVLLRLLIEHAQQSAADTVLSDDQIGHLNRSLLAAGAVTGELSRGVPHETRIEDWLPFFIQNGAYNSKEQPMGALARAQELFGRIPGKPEIQASENACPIDEWMAEDYGLTIEEQLTLGFALAALAHAFEAGEAVGSHVYIAPENLRDLFVKLGWEHRQGDAVAVIAADRAAFQREFAESGDTLEHIAWEVKPFNRHPFLALDDGGLVLVSPRALLSWLSDGFHYRLLDSAQARSPGRRGKVSRAYTAFAGDLLEDYALDLVRSVHPGERPVGAGRVYGEQPYGHVNSKGNYSDHSSDIAVDRGLDLVLIEVSASRMRADTLLLGDRAAVEDDIDRLLIKKARQLDHCIHALIDGRATIPAGDPEVDMGRIERIWPVIVTAGNITQTQPLWLYIHSKLRGELQQPKVQPLTILDVEDLELVCALVEQGHALHEILARKTQHPWAELELAWWLIRDTAAPHPTETRPAYVEETWERAVKRSLAMMDMTKGIQARN